MVSLGSRGAFHFVLLLFWSENNERDFLSFLVHKITGFSMCFGIKNIRVLHGFSICFGIENTRVLHVFGLLVKGFKS